MGRYFGDMSDHAQVMKEMHCEAQGGSYKRPSYQVVSVGVEISSSSEEVVLRVGTLHVSRISLGVIPIDPFR